MKPVLDPCCGGKMFYFDKNDPSVLFCDCREFSGDLWRGVRPFEVSPDVIVDFCKLPFSDESFYHVVFDPPHITKGGESSWIVKKYGKLPKEWEVFLKSGFDECWRVLRPFGTLNFKWSEISIPVGEILRVIEQRPMYGQKLVRGKTHWMTFFKSERMEK